MPFAGHVSVVAVRLQQAGQGYDLVAEYPLIVVVSHLLGRNGLGNVWHTVSMTVHSGQQHGASRGAIGRGMVVGKRQALRCQSRDIRRTDFAAEGRNIGIAKIVRENQNDIGAISLLRADDGRCAQKC